jgi:hypothetical protein
MTKPRKTTKVVNLPGFEGLTVPIGAKIVDEFDGIPYYHQFDDWYLARSHGQLAPRGARDNLNAKHGTNSKGSIYDV